MSILSIPVHIVHDCQTVDGGERTQRQKQNEAAVPAPGHDGEPLVAERFRFEFHEAPAASRYEWAR